MTAERCLCGHPRKGAPGRDHHHPYRLGDECKACACPVYVPAAPHVEYRRSLRTMSIVAVVIVAAAAFWFVVLFG